MAWLGRQSLYASIVPGSFWCHSDEEVSGSADPDMSNAGSLQPYSCTFTLLENRRWEEKGHKEVETRAATISWVQANRPGLAMHVQLLQGTQDRCSEIDGKHRRGRLILSIKHLRAMKFNGWCVAVAGALNVQQDSGLGRMGSVEEHATKLHKGDAQPWTERYSSGRYEMKRFGAAGRTFTMNRSYLINNWRCYNRYSTAAHKREHLQHHALAPLQR